MTETVYDATDPLPAERARRVTTYHDYPVDEWWLGSPTPAAPTPIIMTCTRSTPRLSALRRCCIIPTATSIAPGCSPQDLPLPLGHLAFAPTAVGRATRLFPITACLPSGGVTLAIGWPAQWLRASPAPLAGGCRPGKSWSTSLQPGERIRTPHDQRFGPRRE
jgi:hypothetical protein